MNKKHVPAYLALWLFDLFAKYNETVFIEVDEKGNPVLKKYSGEDGLFTYVTIYQNDSTATLIKGIKRVKAFKFNDLIMLLKNINDIHIEISDSCFFANKNVFAK